MMLRVYEKDGKIKASTAVIVKTGMMMQLKELPGEVKKIMLDDRSNEFECPHDHVVAVIQMKNDKEYIMTIDGIMTKKGMRDKYGKLIATEKDKFTVTTYGDHEAVISLAMIPTLNTDYSNIFSIEDENGECPKKSDSIKLSDEDWKKLYGKI